MVAGDEGAEVRPRRVSREVRREDLDQVVEWEVRHDSHEEHYGLRTASARRYRWQWLAHLAAFLWSLRLYPGRKVLICVAPVGPEDDAAVHYQLLRTRFERTAGELESGGEALHQVAVLRAGEEIWNANFHTSAWYEWPLPPVGFRLRIDPPIESED